MKNTFCNNYFFINKTNTFILALNKAYGLSNYCITIRGDSGPMVWHTCISTDIWYAHKWLKSALTSLKRQKGKENFPKTGQLQSFMSVFKYLLIGNYVGPYLGPWFRAVKTYQTRRLSTWYSKYFWELFRKDPFPIYVMLRRGNKQQIFQLRIFYMVDIGIKSIRKLKMAEFKKNATWRWSEHTCHWLTDMKLAEWQLAMTDWQTCNLQVAILQVSCLWVNGRCAHFNVKLHFF